MDGRADDLIAVENMRRLFRRTMAESYPRKGEAIEDTVRRLRADPATADVASRLACTIDELLEGFGQPEPFIVDTRYDHDRASAVMDTIIERVIGSPLGLDDPAERDDRVVRFTRNVGVKAAPHVEAARGRIDGDEAAKRQILAGMRRRPVPAAARRR
jgi:hypothetical protein